MRDKKRWVPSEGFRAAFIDVLKIVTAFTVAHSITFSLATLQVVRLPARISESAIAMSVVLAALNNLFPIVGGKRWLVAFCFGLIHGFGFANVLTDLGLPRGVLALALVGFNLGVEAGQIALVAVFLPVAYLLRRTRPSSGGSGVLRDNLDSVREPYVGNAIRQRAARIETPPRLPSNCTKRSILRD